MPFLKAFIRYSVLVIMVVSCSPQGGTTGNVFAPDVLDLPVLKGSFISENSGIEEETQSQSSDAEQTFLGCIAFDHHKDLDTVNQWMERYLESLRQLGWQFAGGAANAAYLDKPAEESKCIRRLVVAASLLGDNEEIEKLPVRGIAPDWSKIPYGVLLFGEKSANCTE